MKRPVSEPRTGRERLDGREIGSRLLARRRVRARSPQVCPHHAADHPRQRDGSMGSPVNTLNARPTVAFGAGRFA